MSGKVRGAGGDANGCTGDRENPGRPTSGPPTVPEPAVAPRRTRMPVPVIVDAARTPYGRRGGSLSGVHAVELLGGMQTAVLERTGLAAALVTEVVGGCVTQAGEQS